MIWVLLYLLRSLTMVGKIKLSQFSSLGSNSYCSYFTIKLNKSIISEYYKFSENQELKFYTTEYLIEGITKLRVIVIIYNF